MKRNLINNINNIKVQYQSTTSENFEKAKLTELQTKSQTNNTKLVEDAYLSLMTEIIVYLNLKDSKSQYIDIPFTADDLKQAGVDTMPFNIKKFCSDVRVASNSSFGRNFLEILLFPISKNVVVAEATLQLTRDINDNHSFYKDLIFNDGVREACIKYIDQIPLLAKSTITTRTTLKSFKRDSIIQGLLTQIKDNTLDQQGRYALVGLFLESILFEIVNNTGSKHSKARIVNYIVELLSKSRV